jgi:type 1 glutamine amidotransferase
MKRREVLAAGGAAFVGLSLFPLRWASALGADELHVGKKKQKVLYFTRSAGFEHSPVRRSGGELAFSEKVFTEMCGKVGIDVQCSKDGSLFDGDLDQWDALAFYTSGDLTKPKEGQDKPMSPEGKQKLLDAIKAGKPFLGFHSATDSFRSGGIDPYIEMIGAEFCGHGKQQQAMMKLVSPKFPGCEGLGDGFKLLEEWYAFKKFNPETHVVLVQETEGMEGPLYQRPPFPATWARMQGKGRVFYTSLGHREDVWTNDVFQKIVLGGLAWALGNVQADVTPNFRQVTPKANEA